MPTNDFNGRLATLEKVPAGTLLHRILPTFAPYAANSYNPTFVNLGYPLQGRFEPAATELGGYTYVAESVTGAVAEGILRNVNIPKSGIARHMWLKDKKIATMELEEDILVAAIYGQHALALNLDASLLCGGADVYTDCREIGTKILLAQEEARGIKYTCRNNTAATALMLVTRDGDGPRMSVKEERDVLVDDQGRKLILETMATDYGLHYLGPIPGQRS
ncbi:MULTISPECIES: RES family NAD+ phosphorylase [Actinomycetes]|jgi:hypothetical protein|uniref:RES family NAD+ phosphorylase n=1 Tax=Actinomycetes TaxID=1760 RepID=UPI0004BEBBDA|nr:MULTISPECIES: RES family NAD+ phosphorylase [Actinomycetes]